MNRLRLDMLVAVLLILDVIFAKNKRFKSLIILIILTGIAVFVMLKEWYG